MAASFLLGNRRDAVQARIGLADRCSAAATVVYNDPTTRTGELVFVPVLFAIGWLAGFALRERAEQAEAQSSAPPRPSGSATPRPASPSPRSARGSRASCTTSSPTR